MPQKRAVATSGHSRPRLPRAVSFWLLAAVLTLFLFAASAPSPLYPVYQSMWHFSSTTLTAIYAVYAVGGLSTLLITGRLPDHLGRRPVVMAALVVQIAGMACFVAADSVAALFVGRFAQGLATGLATPAVSAWLLDLQPADNPRLGGLMGGVALLAGLGSGALGSGVLVQYAPHPLRLVFWLLAAVYAAALLLMPFVSDVAPRRPGWRRSLRLEIGVPAAARSLFVKQTPSLVATWALAGFYLALGSSLAVSLLHTTNKVAGGFVVFALAGTGAVAAVLHAAANPRSVVIRGSLTLIVGVGTTLIGVLLDSTVAFYVGSAVAGFGLGPAFSAMLRSLAPLAPPEKRAALLSAIYTVLYASFSIPAILAGVSVGRYGLRHTAYGFGLVLIVLAAISTVAVARESEPV